MAAGSSIFNLRYWKFASPILMDASWHRMSITHLENADLFFDLKLFSKIIGNLLIIYSPIINTLDSNLTFLTWNKHHSF